MAVPQDEDRDTIALDPTALRALVGATRGRASPTIPMDDARLAALVDGERGAAPSPRAPRPRARQTALDPAIVVPGGGRYLARGSTGVRPSRLRPVVTPHAAPAARHRTSVLVVVAMLAAIVGAATTYLY